MATMTERYTVRYDVTVAIHYVYDTVTGTRLFNGSSIDCEMYAELLEQGQH